MTRQDIQDQLMEIIRQEKTVPPELMVPQTSLTEAGIDSLDSLTILFAIEEKFHISIPDEKARSITTFRDLIDVIESLSAVPG